MNKTYIIFFSFIFAFAIFSCSKYEDGPLISLKSKKNRLLGEWKVVEFKKDNEDLTQMYMDSCGCDIEFTYDYNIDYGPKDNFVWLKCSYDCGNYDSGQHEGFRSSWTFSENKKKIWMNIGHNINPNYRLGVYPLTFCKYCWSYFEILRLTSDDLWVRHDDFYNVYTIKFEKK